LPETPNGRVALHDLAAHPEIASQIRELVPALLTLDQIDYREWVPFNSAPGHFSFPGSSAETVLGFLRSFFRFFALFVSS
jgi:hypothetical protein